MQWGPVRKVYDKLGLHGLWIVARGLTGRPGLFAVSSTRQVAADRHRAHVRRHPK